jgi:hypothetical protein
MSSGRSGTVTGAATSSAAFGPVWAAQASMRAGTQAPAQTLDPEPSQTLPASSRINPMTTMGASHKAGSLPDLTPTGYVGESGPSTRSLAKGGGGR